VFTNSSRDGHHHGGHLDGELFLTAYDQEPSRPISGDREAAGGPHSRGHGLANYHGAMAGAARMAESRLKNVSGVE